MRRVESVRNRMRAPDGCWASDHTASLTVGFKRSGSRRRIGASSSYQPSPEMLSCVELGPISTGAAVRRSQPRRHPSTQRIRCMEEVNHTRAPQWNADRGRRGDEADRPTLGLHPNRPAGAHPWPVRSVAFRLRLPEPPEGGTPSGLRSAMAIRRLGRRSMRGLHRALLIRAYLRPSAV